MTRTGKGLGRWGVRLLAVLGALLLVLGATGWWLTTRVLSANGFADVVAKSSQRAEVRDYIADQATLRLARTSNFVSAARPIVTDALSAAIDTPPVTEAIYDFALRAHQQIFRASNARRVNVDAAEAAVTVRSALQTVNPALAKKLPPNVLSATTTISQSSTVDTLFRASKWIRALYIPVFLAGLILLALVAVRARDRVHALRVIGVTVAVAGALLLGVGVVTPLFSSAAATNAPGRGDAVAAFIGVLAGGSPARERPTWSSASPWRSLPATTAATYATAGSGSRRGLRGSGRSGGGELPAASCSWHSLSPRSRSRAPCSTASSSSPRSSCSMWGSSSSSARRGCSSPITPSSRCTSGRWQACSQPWSSVSP